MKKYLAPITELVEEIALSKCVCFSRAGGGPDDPIYDTGEEPFIDPPYD